MRPNTRSFLPNDLHLRQTYDRRPTQIVGITQQRGAAKPVETVCSQRFSSPMAPGWVPAVLRSRICMSYGNDRQSRACAAGLAAATCGWHLARVGASVISVQLDRDVRGSVFVQAAGCRDEIARPDLKPAGTNGPRGPGFQSSAAAREAPLCGSCGPHSGTGAAAQPRPTNGILVAMMVMNCTLVSSGRLAIVRTACPT